MLTRRGFALGAVSRAIAPLEDGSTIEISGETCALVDVLAPRLFEPGGEFARAVAARISRTARLVEGPFARDRWGRRLGPLYATDVRGAMTSVEAMLVAAGAARVNPQSDDLAMISALLAGEGRARDAARGGWRNPGWRVRDANSETERAYGFQIYEGNVVSARRVRSRVYINFGPDWREDVTASAGWGAFRGWKPRRAPEHFVGARVRVRGLVAPINGPSIEVAHASAIEIIAIGDSAKPTTE